MAHKGTAFFDGKGHFFKTPEDATVSDLAQLLGQTGEGESLATGIAQKLLVQREAVLKIFAEYEEIKAGLEATEPSAAAKPDNVARLRERRSR